jgi:formylglycine-generating enzyme required for sulfatase activity
VVASEDRQAILERVTDWLVESLAVLPDAGGLPARQRAQAGDVLSRLGDPRFDPNRHFLPHGDDLGFVTIPGRDHLRFARYPVTVAQFRAFFEDSGFEPGDPDCLRDPDHRPVRYVNHAEALAYCKWLSGTGCLPDGWRADLPDEHEWEHASRGGQPGDWDYWWDKKKADPEKANYGDSGIGDTSVVGCFPANGYGLYDMLGNVWEWTSSLYKEGKTYLVMRGGSWVFSASLIHCAYRGRSRRRACVSGLGFRVVLRCSPV